MGQQRDGASGVDSGYLPYVIEQFGDREKAYDIYSRLMKDRIIFLGTIIDDWVANAITAQLLFLNLQDRKKEIAIYINSPGGTVTSGMAVYDTMKYLSNPISTYCIGQCASMAAILLAAGAKGKRFALPHAQIMIHQPWGGAEGPASDVTLAAKNLERWKQELNKVLSECTGRKLKLVEKDTDRDNYMTAAEAVKYGIVDKVLDREQEVEDRD